MPIVIADTNRQYLDYSVGYIQGDYGTSQTSTLMQLQVTYGLVVEKSDFSVSIPYQFISDEYGDDHGLGDITLRAGMELLSNASQTDILYGSLALKLPTGDKKAGMGTGEEDVGAFFAYTHYTGKMAFSILGGYILTGDAVHQRYNDIAVYGISFFRTFTKLTTYVSLDGQENTISSSEAPLEFSLGVYYQLGLSRFIKLEGLVGLNDASPDYGISAGIVDWY